MSRIRRHAPSVGFLIIIGYLVLVPLFRLQQKALANGGEAYRTLADVSGFGTTLRTTVALALGSLAIALVLGTGLAWADSRLPRRLQWLGVMPILPIVLPPVANVIGWAFLFNPRVGFVNQWLRKLPWWRDSVSGPVDIFTPTWIVIVTGIALTSFVYVFVRSGLRRLNFELTEAAQVAGASPTRAFFGLILPLLRPSLVYGGSIALLLGLGQFTGPLLLGTRNGVSVMTTEMYRYIANNSDYPTGAAMASPLLAVGILVVFAQRRVLNNEVRFVTDTGKGIRSVSRTSRVAAIVLGLFGFSCVIFPLLSLLVVALSPFYSGKIDPSVFTLHNFTTLFDSPSPGRAIRTSLFVATAGVLVSLPVGYIAADMLHRKRASKWVRNAIDLIVNLPLGIPAVVFGAGFFFTYTQKPFVLYGTTWVIVLVYVTLMLPFTTRMQLAARMALGDAYENASRISGASPLRTHLSIILPLTRSALSGAGALMFVLLCHEFSASLLVRSTRTQVMGTVIYDLWTNSSYTSVAAMALVLCAITTAGVGLAVKLGGGSGTLDRL